MTLKDKSYRKLGEVRIPRNSKTGKKIEELLREIEEQEEKESLCPEKELAKTILTVLAEEDKKEDDDKATDDSTDKVTTKTMEEIHTTVEAWENKDRVAVVLMLDEKTGAFASHGHGKAGPILFCLAQFIADTLLDDEEEVECFLDSFPTLVKSLWNIKHA